MSMKERSLLNVTSAIRSGLILTPASTPQDIEDLEVEDNEDIGGSGYIQAITNVENMIVSIVPS